MCLGFKWVYFKVHTFINQVLKTKSKDLNKGQLPCLLVNDIIHKSRPSTNLDYWPFIIAYHIKSMNQLK
jgi:hypothetical protein